MDACEANLEKTAVFSQQGPLQQVRQVANVDELFHRLESGAADTACGARFRASRVLFARRSCLCEAAAGNMRQRRLWQQKSRSSPSH